MRGKRGGGEAALKRGPRGVRMRAGMVRGALKRRDDATLRLPDAHHQEGGRLCRVWDA